MDYHFTEDLAALLPEIPADSIVSRAVHTSLDAKVTLFGFAPGQELTEHTASKPAILHFLQGHADLNLGGDAHSAQAGTWVHMPAQLPHSIVAQDEVLMLLIMFQ